jgi:hypothetical protein
MAITEIIIKVIAKSTTTDRATQGPIKCNSMITKAFKAASNKESRAM